MLIVVCGARGAVPAWWTQDLGWRAKAAAASVTQPALDTWAQHILPGHVNNSILKFTNLPD